MLSGLLLLCSLLTVFKAPTKLLWKLSIVMMEWGHYFAVVCLLCLLFRNNSLLDKLSMSATLLAFVLFLTPLIRAYSVARNLDVDVEKAFGEQDAKVVEITPLSLVELFAGKKIPANTYETYSYKETGGKALTMDFYPSALKHSPCVLVIHGGGWDSGDSQQLPEINAYLAQKGYAVASINYRLAPKYLYPDQISDVKDAILYLKKNHVELGIDPSNLVLLGRSAGGQLALQAAYTFNDADIRGVISFYAPADMVWGYSIPGNPWIMDSRKVLSDYLGGGCDAIKEKYLDSSPVEHITPSSPPTLLLHGQPDVLVAFEHSIRLNKKLSAAGVKHLLIDLPWATHGFDFNPHGPGSQISRFAIERFLSAVTAIDNTSLAEHSAAKKYN